MKLVIATLLLLPPAAAWAAHHAGELVGLIRVNNDAEISLGKVAAKKARSQDVKRFGQMMVDHHTASNEELKAQARAKKDKTDAVKALKEKAKADAARLNALDAAQFDAAYIDQQIEAHRTLLGALDRALADRASLGPDAALIEKTRGVVAAHLQEATRIRGTLGR